MGDTSFGEYYQRMNEITGSGNVLRFRGYDYPLMNFKRILGDSFFVFANLEAPVTSIKVSPYRGMKKYLNAERPGVAPGVLKKHHFGAVSLANNHAGDFGNRGLKETLNSLSMQGIDAFGAGKDPAHAARPYILSVPVSDREYRVGIIPGFEYRDRYQREYRYYARDGKAGVALLSPRVTGVVIRSLRARFPHMLIIVYPHWGVNYSWRDRSQRATAESLLKDGADLIIGHGAHHFQEIEMIAGKWVVYNIGNFMFNSPGRYREKGAHPYSMLARLLLKNNSIGGSIMLRLYPIHTDNMKNRYQGRFLTEQEFAGASALLLEKSGINSGLKNSPESGKDNYGLYLEMRVR